MKNRRGSREPHFIDSEFVDALEESGSGNTSFRRQEERKTRQFCRQVQRPLNVAITERNICDGMEGLFVEEVSPAPECGRLLVHVLIPAGVLVADVLSALNRETPRLRSEVASAIARKRAPELCFVPAYPERDGNE